MTDTVLILRTCRADGTSYNNFQWPDSGPVEAPDFDPEPRCGGGLHGLLWGEGKVGYLDLSPGAQWKVFRAHVSDVVHGAGELTDKCKARRGVVEYSGDREGAIKYLYEHGASGKAVVFGTSTSGDHGTSTSGAYGTSTSGDGGTSTSGDFGTSTSGDHGTSTSGYHGTSTSGDFGTSTSGDLGTSTSGYRGISTAGYGGTIAITWWNGKRFETRVATVKDEYGDGELEPNTPYCLNEHGEFVRVATEAKN